MESRNVPTPGEARSAIQELTEARQRIAERVASPWWYRWGAAASTASLFVGTGLVVGPADPSGDLDTVSTLLTVTGAVVAPAVLLTALKRSTGVSVDRYARGLGAWYAVVFGLFAVAFGLQHLGIAPLALPVAGVGAFLATLVTERRIDSLLAERVGAGWSGP
jgi:hypothetical protein